MRDESLLCLALFVAGVVVGLGIGAVAGRDEGTRVARITVCGVCNDAVKASQCGPLVCTQEGWR
jgi:hypothetical protein